MIRFALEVAAFVLLPTVASALGVAIVTVSSTGGVSTLLEWDGNIPSFSECHAEVLKAKRYMDGNFDPTWITMHGREEQESISNPVDFLVPEVMESTVWEEK